MNQESVRAVVAEAITAYLSVHDAACARCGYNLRGTTNGQCSECGEAVRFNAGAVGRMEAGRPAPMWERLLALVAATVFTLVIGYSLIMMLTMGFGWGGGGRTLALVFIGVCGFVSLGATVMSVRSLRAKEARASYGGMRWLVYLMVVQLVPQVIQLVWGWM